MFEKNYLQEVFEKRVLPQKVALEKNYLQEIPDLHHLVLTIMLKLFGKTCLTSKSISGNVESRSDNSIISWQFSAKSQEIFGKTCLTKSLKNWQFSATNFSLKNSPCPPFWKKNIKLNIVPEINFFQEKFIWEEKDTILTICFQTSKNICRMSRKSLENIDSTKKKDRSPKKPSRFAPSSFDNHAETFQKQYVILLLNFTKTKSLISKKKLSNCLKLSK